MGLSRAKDGLHMEVLGSYGQVHWRIAVSDRPELKSRLFQGPLCDTGLQGHQENTDCLVKGT